MALCIAVLGRGAWGSTLARLWSRSGHRVRSWSRRDGGDPAEALAGADLLVSAVSMAGVEGLARHLGPLWPEGLPLLSCSKGIDLEGLCTATQLWGRHLPPVGMAALSGPNLADELARGLPAASVIASADEGLARRLQAELVAPNLRLYTNADPIGTEAAGALKNVPAGHEVGVSHRQSGGHDRCRAHLRPGRKQDTVGVDQEEGAVCGDAAGDAGSIPAHHAVEGHR